jgi:hypothetical protein
MTDYDTIRKALDSALRSHAELMAEADLPTDSPLFSCAIAALDRIENLVKYWEGRAKGAEDRLELLCEKVSDAVKETQP